MSFFGCAVVMAEILLRCNESNTEERCRQGDGRSVRTWVSGQAVGTC